MEFFVCNKNKIAVKPIIYHNSAENFKITDHKYQFWILKIIAFLAKYSLFGQTTKQSLNNFEPQKPWKYKQLWELRPDPSCL